MRLFLVLFLIAIFSACKLSQNSSKETQSPSPAPKAILQGEGREAPAVVRVEKVDIKDGVKLLMVGNTLGHYIIPPENWTGI